MIVKELNEAAQKLLEKQAIRNEHIEKALDGLIQKFESMELDSNDVTTLKHQVVSLYKDVDSELKAYGKKVEKISKERLTEWNLELLQKSDIMDNVILDHFCHHGWIPLASLFSKEAKLSLNLTEEIQTYHRWIKDIKNGHFERVLQWIETHIPESKLLFLIHKIQYLKLIRQHEWARGIEYAKLHLTQYCQTFPKGFLF
jgi:exonuclease VII small subunit